MNNVWFELLYQKNMFHLIQKFNHSQNTTQLRMNYINIRKNCRGFSTLSNFLKIRLPFSKLLRRV